MKDEYRIVPEALALELRNWPDAPPVHDPRCCYESTDYFRAWASETLTARRGAGDFSAADRLREAILTDAFIVMYQRRGPARVLVDQKKRSRLNWERFKAECSARAQARRSQAEAEMEQRRSERRRA